MNNNEFIYWLQGYFELCRVEGEVKLTQEQILCIEDHLKLCFDKITPERKSINPKGLIDNNIEVRYDGLGEMGKYFKYDNDQETHVSC